MEDITGGVGALNLSGIPGANSASLDDSRDNIASDDSDPSAERLDEDPVEVEEQLDETPTVNISQNIIRPPDAEQRWVKSLNVTYQSTKLHKNVLIEGDDVHFKLRCLENLERTSRDFSGTNPNYVVASVGFVISDRVHEGEHGHHGRRFVSFPIKFGDQMFTQVNDVYTFDEKADDEKTPRSSELKADLIAESSADKKVAIERDYTSAAGPNFVQSYHHSERALWKSLKKSETLDPLFQKLGEVLPAGGKVYCMVLDLHSTRYMCSNCEPSSYIAQQRLKAKFEERFAGKYVTPKKGFFAFSRVSAEINAKRTLREAGVHKEVCAETIQELRSKNMSVVFQRDDRTTKSYQKISGAHGFFVSSDTDRLNDARTFHVFQRMDSSSSRIEVTRLNSNFGKFAKGEAKQVTGLIKKSDGFRKKNQYAEALKCIEDASQIDPDNLAIVNRYCLIFCETKRFMEALPLAKKAYEGYFKIDPAHQNTQNCVLMLRWVREGLLAQVQALVNAKKWDEGLGLAAQATELDDSYGNFYCWCAHILILKGDTAKALDVLSYVIDGMQFDAEMKSMALTRKTALLETIQKTTEAQAVALRPPGSSGL